MNEFFSEPKQVVSLLEMVISGLSALLVGIISWNIRGYVRRIEKLEDIAVTKQDLDALKKQLASEHAENKVTSRETRVEIGSGMRSIHARVDELYRDLPQMIRNIKSGGG